MSLPNLYMSASNSIAAKMTSFVTARVGQSCGGFVRFWMTSFMSEAGIWNATVVLRRVSVVVGPDYKRSETLTLDAIHSTRAVLVQWIVEVPS